MTDTNDQPGACAPVPLPDVAATITSWSNGSYWRNYRVAWQDDSMEVNQQLVRIENAIAYGEACAAAERAGFDLALGMRDYGDAVSAYRLQQAERERDEQRARAEAAEAKIAGMEGRR